MRIGQREKGVCQLSCQQLVNEPLDCLTHTVGRIHFPFHILIEPRLSHQYSAGWRGPPGSYLFALDLLTQKPLRASRVAHQVRFTFTALDGKVGVSEFQGKSKSSLLNRFLQWSDRGCKVNLAISKRRPCGPVIHSVQFELPWSFCTFLVSLLKKVHTQDDRGISQVEIESWHGVGVSGSGPTGWRTARQTLTTTTYQRR